MTTRRASDFDLKKIHIHRYSLNSLIPRFSVEKKILNQEIREHYATIHSSLEFCSESNTNARQAIPVDVS